MKIAQLAPLWKEIPPKKYGGTELIVSYITEELVKRGHEVTLFACGISRTKARLVSIISKTLYELKGGFDWSDISYNVLNARKCFEMADSFDIIHNHMSQEALVFSPFVKTPVVSTCHSSAPPDFPHLARAMKNENYISISDAQRRNAPYLNYVATIYHGIEVEKFEFNDRPKNYLFFMGTMSPTKGVDIACRIAKRLNMRLILAGDIRKDSLKFFKEKVKPYVDGRKIKFLGEIDFKTKVKLYKNALAFIYPVRWNEAFGLVIPEALACGTPVIAFGNGSMPEIIDDGKTGFIVEPDNIFGLEKAVKKINKIDRKICRQVAEQRFTVKRMVDDYEFLYRRFVKK